MTPESTRYLDKAAQCLSNARAVLGINLANDAGRNAYFAVFHAAQALIFERTGKISKSHNGVQSQFAVIVKNEPNIDESFVIFLSQAYILKAVADYETGLGSTIRSDRAAAAIEMAEKFLDCIRDVLPKTSP